MDMTVIVAIVTAVIILIFILAYASEESKRNQIICPNPNCGYKGKGKESGGKSGCLLIILLLFGILPGILYLLFAGSKSIVCPKCGCKIR